MSRIGRKLTIGPAFETPNRPASAPLEDPDDDAERGGDGQQEAEGRLERHQDRAEHEHQQDKASPTTTAR